ncbi:MAG: M23 family metallopeptidase [Caulobacteraceae bacterium]
MMFRRLARLGRPVTRLFPERHLHLHSGVASRSWRLTPARQMAIAGAAAVGAVWLSLSTLAMMSGAFHRTNGEIAAARTEARLKATTASVDRLAGALERRHEALATLLIQAQGAAGTSAPIPATAISRSASPIDRLQAVRADQDRLIAEAETFATNRADRLRLAFRLAGLRPAAYAQRTEGMGGPLLAANDPRALAATLDVDQDFARRVGRAALDLSAMHVLDAAAAGVPLARPTVNTVQSSGFGVRVDPFTGERAFHPGLDFAGAYKTPIHSTAPGVVVFTGQKSGYGNTIEIDHGHGFKTRYGHLQSIGVHIGQRVALGQTIGAMGSTGRSTGDHLHYEIWLDGRVQNPLRFVRAGDYARQNG